MLTVGQPACSRRCASHGGAGTSKAYQPPILPVGLQGQDIHRRTPDKPGGEQIDRLIVQLPGRGDLLDTPVLQDHDQVTQRQRLDLVVRHIERRPA